MEKEQFKRELQLALKDPKQYFEIRKSKHPLTGQNETLYSKYKLNKFFQEFSNHYLDPDVAELTDKFPVVKFKHMEDHDNRAVGKYNHKENEINLNVDMFLKGSMSSTVFTGFLATLCHEHQHFKQNLYVDLKKAGKEDQAKKLEPMLGISPESTYGVSIEEIEKSIKHPAIGSSLVAHECFMEYTIPKQYKQMKSGSLAKDWIGKKFGKHTPLEVAHYFHDPHEVDARERAVDVFDKKFSEISQGDPLIDKYKNRMTKILTKFNKAALGIQPKRVVDLYESEKSKIDAEQILAYADKIEKGLKKDKVDISQINDQGIMSFNDKHPSQLEVDRQAFIIVLKERLSTLPKQEAQTLLETLQSSGNEYAAHIAGQFLGKPEISKPTASQIAEEKESLGISDPSPEIDYTSSKSQTSQKELSPEELQELEQRMQEQQMAKNPYDD